MTTTKVPGAGLHDQALHGHDARSPDRRQHGCPGRDQRRQRQGLGNNLWAWAGVRSDPFFFDLTGFIGTTTLLTTGTPVGDDAWATAPDRLLREPEHQRDRPVDPERAAARHHRRLGDHEYWSDGTAGARRTRWAARRSTPCSTRPPTRTPSTRPRRIARRRRMGGKFRTNVDQRPHVLLEPRHRRLVLGRSGRVPRQTS